MLRAARKRAGYSLAGLAGLLDMTAGRLSGVELGREAPLAPPEIERAARALETDPRPLLAAQAREYEREFHKQWPGLGAARRPRR